MKVVKLVQFDSANSEAISFAGFLFMNVTLLDVWSYTMLRGLGFFALEY